MVPRHLILVPLRHILGEKIHAILEDVNKLIQQLVRSNSGAVGTAPYIYTNYYSYSARGANQPIGGGQRWSASQSGAGTASYGPIGAAG